MDKSFYENEIAVVRQSLARATRYNNRFVLGRTVVFVLLVLSLAAVYDGHGYLLWAALCLGAAFVALVRFHELGKRQAMLLSSRLEVLEDCLARFGTEWKDFSQDGSLYLKRKRPQDTDLNIFGVSSLYQYLCRARTKGGRDYLAECLTPQPPPVQIIRQRQKAVKELLAHPRLCLDLEALGRLLPDGHDTAPLVQSVEEGQVAPSRLLAAVAWLLPLITIAAVGLAAADLVAWTAVLFLPLLQLTLAILFNSRNNEILSPLDRMQQELRLYGHIFSRLEEASFTGSHLRSLQNNLHTDPPAAGSLKRLAYLATCANMRRNLSFFLLGNALLLWDFHCAAYFVRWQYDTARHLRTWLNTWSEVEALLSLATVGETRASCFPEILESSTPRINGQELTSLLIPAAKAVPNDVHLRPETNIITGSNMSGKTTWLRTIATNVILAYAGAPVCAKSLALTRFALFTSMRVNDDLGEGLSTFYAELLRIKEMVEYSRQKEPMLICIDEIFKGTNSADRIIGAKEAILRLTAPWIILLVTTHDFELCEITTPAGNPVKNGHFEEYYRDNKIYFDFKLKEGRCHTTNAQYLLRMAGIMVDMEKQV